MSVRFEGFDHIDLRVPSLAKVEAFYSELLPALGLSLKTYVRIEPREGRSDEWVRSSAHEPYNALEFFEQAAQPGAPVRFLGVIEDGSMQPAATRIAFALAQGADFDRWARQLRAWGAGNVEFHDDMAAYPAIFFEDPCGTRLEICARLPR